jgi:predicted secreted protein
MTTQARIGHGSKFRVGDGASPEVFTAIAEVTSITPPSITRDVIDATNADSPDGWREHIPGLKDGGEVSIEGNFIPGGTGDQQLIVAQLDTFARSYQIEFPNGEIWDFKAFCTAYEPSAPFDDKMTFSATFKVSGKPQFVTDAEEAA